MMLTKFALAFGLLVGGNALADGTVSSTSEGSPTVAASASLNPASPAWQLVMEQRYAIPYGIGFSPIYDFGARPLEVEALEAQVFVERGQFCGATIYSVDVTYSPSQTLMSRVYPDANGQIRLPNATIYKLGFVFNQTFLRGGNCLVRLSALTQPDDGDTDQPDGGFQLAGVVRYEGGFQDQLALATDGADKVKQFWVRVPEFCGQVEVLEAGTVTEGHYEAARLVDRAKQVYEVNGGAGTRLSEVRLTINGPRNASCDIPVYFQSVRQ